MAILQRSSYSRKSLFISIYLNLLKVFNSLILYWSGIPYMSKCVQLVHSLSLGTTRKSLSLPFPLNTFFHQISTYILTRRCWAFSSSELTIPTLSASSHVTDAPFLSISPFPLTGLRFPTILKLNSTTLSLPLLKGKGKKILSKGLRHWDKDRVHLSVTIGQNRFNIGREIQFIAY